MTSRKAVEFTRQNIGEKAPSHVVMTGVEFLHQVLQQAIIPNLVTRYEWSWKYGTFDVPAARGAWELNVTLPPIFGLNSFVDDLYGLVLMTGSIGTSVRIRQRNLRWFLDRYPIPAIQVPGRPSWCTLTFHENNMFQVWLDRPLDNDYTIRYITISGLQPVGLDEELPVRKDKHMLLVVGLTAWALTAMEPVTTPTAGGTPSPATYWQTLYEQGVTTWWEQDQAQSGVETDMGFYQPRLQGFWPTEYWSDPFIRTIR